MDSEDVQRARVVEEALSWVGTPYHPNGDVKGAGVDCGMLLVRVFVDLHLVRDFDPRPYPIQWSIHQRQERYLDIVQALAREIPGPPLPGDLVMFRVGHGWAHAGIVTVWPEFVHANPPRCEVANRNQYGYLRKREARFFTIWGGGN